MYLSVLITSKSNRSGQWWKPKLNEMVVINGMFWRCI